ncbi:ABC transporter ATP-binding protein, partial [Actinosynnema sp. NPDC023658]|uniref:ABC transporter ATP-binding protein n=1 Tax=Actinosynnema sp. NPDC023658 TaxID=3155465 RepID=UPI0033F9FC9E
MRTERLALLVVVTLGVISVAFSVAGPKILGHATDIIFEGVLGRMRHVPGAGVDFDALGAVLLWVMALYLTSSVFGWLQGRVLNNVVQRFVFRLRSDVEDKLHRLPLRYFDGQPRGELLSRVTNDIDNVATTLQQTLSQLLTSLLTVVGVLVMMLTISPLLTLIALLLIPISVVATGRIRKKSQALFVAQWKHTGALNAHIEEAFTGHQLVKVFGRQRESEQEFKRRNDELLGSAMGAQFVSGLIMPMMMFLSNVSYVAVAVVGGLRITSGAMSLGEVTAFIQYSRQFTQPLTQVASMANLMQSGVASAERVFELLDAEEQEPDPAEATLPAERRGRVEFEHVDFSYRPEQPLITDLSLVAEPGQTVAIVGPTGAGKTTLVNLIMRFYELDAGRITLEGVDITALKREDLRSQTGMVLQDTWLFGGTIRDNIAYGNTSATEEDIVAAARATYVDRFVRTLPDGYDTVINEEATNVSAGEKQLITIARAFLANPSLLILDEATSSVDTRT